jgi:hypothetical protein
LETRTPAGLTNCEPEEAIAAFKFERVSGSTLTRPAPCPPLAAGPVGPRPPTHTHTPSPGRIHRRRRNPVGPRRGARAPTAALLMQVWPVSRPAWAEPGVRFDPSGAVGRRNGMTSQLPAPFLVYIIR